MGNALTEALAKIDRIRSVDDESDLVVLDEGVRELFEQPHPEMGVDTLLRVFERFPIGDGNGIFWSILHGLESLSGHYEAKLIESVRRAPSEFSVVMVNRMLNAGEIEACGVSLLALLRDVSANGDLPAEVRERAGKLVVYQTSK